MIVFIFLNQDILSIKLFINLKIIFKFSHKIFECSTIIYNMFRISSFLYYGYNEIKLLFIKIITKINKWITGI